MTKRAVIIALAITIVLMLIAHALGKSLATFTTSLLVWLALGFTAFRRSRPRQ